MVEQGGPSGEAPQTSSPNLRDEVAHLFEAGHRTLEPAALDQILRNAAPLELSRALLDKFSESILTEQTVSRFVREAFQTVSPEGYEKVADGYRPHSRKVTPEQGYRELFTDRYQRLHRILRGRPALKNLISIRDVPRHRGEEFSVIGMVREVRHTEKSHHLMLTLDDLTGESSFLIGKDNPQSKGAFLHDEVLGLRVWLPKEGDLAYVKEVVHPGVPVPKEPHKTAFPSKVLFLSDLHVGSKMFLREEWHELTAFLNGRTEQSTIAEQIRHVVVAGDLVDGIGIYPGQERDLAVLDILEQYRELGRLLSEFPKRLNIVLIPGNHDAVCPAEPQPPLPEVFARVLPSNVRLGGNPSLFSLDGVLIQAYHGRGFDNIVPNIPGARYEAPTEVMKHMLNMRHLSPSFGQKIPLAPLPRDGLLIDPLPDIFVTGHTHTAGIERHKGVTLINASAWIAETEYQRMRNVKPEPAQAFLMDLAKSSATQLDFSVR